MEMPAGWTTNGKRPYHMGPDGKCWCLEGHTGLWRDVAPWPTYWQDIGMNPPVVIVTMSIKG